MQKVAFTRFGVSRGQEGAANLGAAEFQVSSKGCEVGALKASHSASCGKFGLSRLGHSVSGAFGRLFAAAVWAKSQICAKFSSQIQGKSLVCERVAQRKAENSAARVVQSVAKMGARVINSARVSSLSLSLSLSRSVSRAF